MNIKIEKGIPVPPMMGKDSGEITRILKSMKVGDSIVIPLNLRIRTYGSARYHKIKIVTRTINRDTARVWRTE
jgi:hypothetical protein